MIVLWDVIFLRIRMWHLEVPCPSVLVWLWRSSPIACWGRGRIGPGCETAVRRTCGLPGRRCSRAGRRATGWGPCGRARCGYLPDPPPWGWWDADHVSFCPRCCSTAGDCCWCRGSSAYLSQRCREVYFTNQIRTIWNFIKMKDQMKIKIKF